MLCWSSCHSFGQDVRHTLPIGSSAQCWINSDLHVPGHMVLRLRLQLRLRSVKVLRQVAVEPFRLTGPASSQREQYEMEAIGEWAALTTRGLAAIHIDDLYVVWSGIWERYLRKILRLRGPQTRGVVRPPVQASQAPLRARYSHFLRRLCRFLNDSHWMP